jgi:hypothetical protein
VKSWQNFSGSLTTEKSHDLWGKIALAGEDTTNRLERDMRARQLFDLINQALINM